jgi:hypothetical protein
MSGMSLSGVANQGVDVGGFAGAAPEAELLLRWVQNCIRYFMNCTQRRLGPVWRNTRLSP